MERVGDQSGRTAAVLEEIVMPEFDIIEDSLPPGLSVIEASAGTGKTHTLGHLVPRLLLDGTVESVSQIVLVTYTKDAARELSQRVRQVLEQLEKGPTADEKDDVRRLREKFAGQLADGVVRRALLEIDLLRVSTIHSFCQQVLQTEGALCGLPVMPDLVADVADIAEQEFHALWESGVSGHALAAATAARFGWKFGGDLKFILNHLANHHATPVPQVDPDYTAVLRRLETVSTLFTPEIIAEIRNIFDAITDWNGDAEPQKLRNFLDDLANQPEYAADALISNLAFILSLPDWISRRKKTHQDLAQKAASCRAFGMANEIDTLCRELHWSFLLASLRAVYTAVEKRLKTGRLISYDGLIGHLHDALQNGAKAESLRSRLRERYRIALVDESQDTDPRQFGIFSKVFTGSDEHRLLLIGDPKQAIYEFRGADVNTYLEAKDDASEVFGRNQTHRAHQPLVAAWNALFTRPGSLLKEGLACEEASSALVGDRFLSVDGKKQEARMEFWVAPDSDAPRYSAEPERRNLVAAQTATKIVELLKKSTLTKVDAEGRSGQPLPVKPQDCAVLVADHYQAKAVEDALKARNVPSVRTGTDDVMASDEASDLLLLLRALDAPRRKGSRLAALATRLLGRTDIELEALAESEEVKLDEFLRWTDVFVKEGPSPAVALIDREEGVVARLAKGEDGDRRITNLRQLCDLLQAAFAECGNHPAKFLRWYEGEVSRAGGRNEAEERQIQLESDAEAVRIVTVHKAKGLQYPLVFCPFLWQAKAFTGKNKPTRYKLSRRGEDDALVDLELDPAQEAKLYRNQLEQNLRLAYVAVTRAEVAVWIHAGELCGKENGASAVDWLLRTDFLEAENSPPGADDLDLWRESAGTAGRGNRHAAGLDCLMERASTIRWHAPPPQTNEKWDTETDVVAIRPAEQAPSVPAAWRLTSYSNLTEGADGYEGAGPAARGELGESSATPATERNPFLDAAGGSKVGDAVHKWMEQWSFGKVDPSAVTKFFEAFALPKKKNAAGDEPSFNEAFGGMLGILREAVLPVFDCTIAEACPDAASSEWHFHLPLRKDRPLDPASLAGAFEQFPPHGYEGYHRMVADLKAGALKGFLHGIMDRVAVDPASGRWGIIDWKTNVLRSYDTSALREEAMESHYVLQSHLYLVALRRHLAGKAVSPPCDAWIVFLRGVARNTSDGILHIRPSDDLLSALDELFEK
jgi:exodeoxyribonuclease V beta subunit